MKKNHKRFALISTFDKSKLYKVCKTLIFYNISIIATDSTAQQIKSYGFDCKTVSNITKYKEILDGRVKTLNPIIHGSLLFKRNNPNHLKEAIKNNHPLIDFVIVNLYPFKKAKNHGNFEKILEMIDIGGVAILRSASKNFRSVTTINGLEHYNKFIKELKINRGITSIGFRKKMAINTFHKTANYDLEIYKWLNKNNLQPNNKNSTKLKYGENPDQKAEYKFNKKQNCIFNNVISGKTLSYNNILDVDSGMECMHEFSEPTCVIIKHNTPCGVASSQNIKLAYHRALSCDPISSFGGVYIFNRSINENLANSLYKKYTDVICAPQFTKKALIKLKEKKDLILIKTKNLKLKKIDKRNVLGGSLEQKLGNNAIKKINLIEINKYKINKRIVNDLIFALKVCKHVKSNAIVIAYKKQTLGIGAGQMSRIGATKLCLSKILKNNKIKSFVAASDGFFPFNDSVELLNKHGCNALVSPSGSKNDNNLIKYVKKNKINLLFSKNRFFKH